LERSFSQVVKKQHDFLGIIRIFQEFLEFLTIFGSFGNFEKRSPGNFEKYKVLGVFRNISEIFEFLKKSGVVGMS
jgi:hypothetical protein